MQVKYMDEIISTRKIRRHKSKSGKNEKDYMAIIKRVRRNGIKVDYVSAYIDRIMGEHVTGAQLIAFATSIADKYNVKVDRLAKRNRNALLCWIAENWNIVQPNINDIKLEKSESETDFDEEISSPDMKIEPSYIDPSDIRLLLNYHH